jgi:hypothetical protein
MVMDWRVPINEIRFGLTFTQEITDRTVRWNADNAVHYAVFDRGPEVYYEAIREALASGEHLDGLRQLRQFDQAPAGDALPGKYVMMLRLATGETVALLGRYARGEKVTLLAEDADPAETIEHFIDATGFPANKVIPI